MILFYSELSPEERLEVEQYTEAHPAMKPLLAEAKAFTALLSEARLLRATPPGAEALAYYIATRHVSPHPVPAPFEEAFTRLEKHLTQDADLRAHYAELVRRMAVLEAASDPVSQFERLSGQRLPEEPLDAAPPQTSVPAAGLPASGRRPVVLRLWRQVGRWAVAALFFGLALYGSLRLVSYYSQSDLDHLAALTPSTLPAQTLQLRSSDPVPNYVSSDELYARAVPLLREARTHTLGLFPHYDQATLHEAADLLQRIIDQEDSTSLLRSEAYFLLAKICLAQRDVDGARAALHAVLDGPGWKKQEARTLLEQLEALPD